MASQEQGLGVVRLLVWQLRAPKESVPEKQSRSFRTADLTLGALLKLHLVIQACKEPARVQEKDNRRSRAPGGKAH